MGEAQEKDILAIELPDQPASLLQITVVGKYALVRVAVDNGNSQHHIYFADLEKIGEIRGKLQLTPIFERDLSSAFHVSGTTKA